MSKYIWEYLYDSGAAGGCNKYTVVYDNKTYYYCKVNGTDELKKISKEFVYDGSTRYFLSKSPELDKNVKGFETRREIARLKDKIISCDSCINGHITTTAKLTEEKKIAQETLVKLKDQNLIDWNEV